MERRITWHGFSMAMSYVLLVSVCLSWLRGLSTAALGSSLLVVLVSALAPAETSVCLLFACFPFFNVMGVELGGVSLYYLLILIAVAKAFISGMEDHPGARWTAYLLIVLMTFYNVFAGQAYLRWLLHLLVPVLLVGSTWFKHHFPRCIWYLTVSFLIADIAGFMMMNAGIYLYTSGEVWTAGELTTRYSGLIGDPVFFGQFSAVLIAVNSFLVYLRRARRFTVPISVVLAFFTLLAYSKAGILSLAIVGVFILVAFVVKTVRGGIPLKSLVIAIIAVLVAYFGAMALLSGSTVFSIDALNTRLNSGDMLTGRTQIWQGYVSLWNDEGVFIIFKGIGFDAYSNTFVWSSFNKCHNLYIEAVTLFGFIQAILMFAILAAHLFRRAKTGAGIMSFLPCIVLLATGFVLHGFTDTPFFYEWTIALGCLDYAVALKHWVSSELRDVKGGLKHARIR